MFIKSIISGSVITAILISVLASTRLMSTTAETKELELFELEQIMMEPPPEPPMEEEELEETSETLPQPPIPSLDLIQDTAVDTVALPLTQASFNPELDVNSFEIDRAPADLPVVKTKPKYTPKPKSKPKRKYTPKPTKKPKYTPKPKSKPKPAPPRKVVKAYYSTGELDGSPRAIRQGSFTWPRRAKGTSGTVRMVLEISTSGRVKVISVTSSSDPNLISPAKRVASGSRYTPPLYRGKPVKARFTKTYHLKKP